MSSLKRSILILLLAVSFLMIKNNAFALEEQNDINTDVLGYSYVNNTVLGEQSTAYDVSPIGSLSYSPKRNNNDISDFTFMTKDERQMLKAQNKYAAYDNDLVFDPTNSTMEDVNFWVRPYATIEKVKTGEDKFKAKTYGVYAGVNSGIKELSHGWDFIWGGYVGYNGAHLNDEFFKSYINGGTLGLESMFLKGNFFTGVTANVGAASGELTIRYYDYDLISTTYMNAGVSNKTGYNWELADGKFIIQPNMVTSYVFSHLFGHTKHYGPEDYVSVENDSLFGVLLEPGVNFIGKFDNGWEPYAGVSVVWNIAHSNHVIYPYATMPDLASRCFVKYGLGVKKNWNDRFGANLQTFVRNGGRSGIGFQGGFNVALGK